MRLAQSMRSRRAIGGFAALLLAAVAVGLATGADSDADRDDGSSAATTHRGGVASAQPCGVQSAATVASVDAQVAERIYQDELLGRETRADQARVRESTALLGALSSGHTAAIAAAVRAIVYTPHWHIVRLRVLRAGRVLADFGGPYVIAPVTGTLRQHGRTLGRYVMSVQDDVGYEKLVSRFIGVPVELYRGRSLLMGTASPAPALPREEAQIVLGRDAYRTRVFTAASFPAGALNVALFVPVPSRPLSSMGCQQLRADTWGSVAMRIAARLQPFSAHYDDFVGVVRAASGAEAFVRSGAHVIAGAKAPRRLPREGTVRIGGRTRWLFSWPATSQVRVYVVAPS